MAEQILSFDSRGVNDARDPYKPRIATFSNPEYAREFGRLFEQASAMAEALRDIFTDDDGDGMLDAAGMERIRAILARVDGKD